MALEMDDPKVSVIIPTYKRREKLKNCLQSLSENTYRNIEIIVVNDDPTENLEELVTSYGGVYVHNDKENYVVKNRNKGAKISSGDILLFVDDDNVLYRDTISALVEKYTKTGRVGLMGPLMFSSDGKLWFWGARSNWLKPFLVPQSKNFSNDDLIQTDVIPNAYMISRELYFNIGGEDESLLFYNEEFDLAIRLKNQGFQNYIYTGSKIIHDYGSLFDHITPFRLYINMRNMLIVERRYASFVRFVPFCVYFFGYTGFYLLYRIPYSMHTNNRKEYYLALFRGIFEGIFSTSKIDRKNLIGDQK